MAWWDHTPEVRRREEGRSSSFRSLASRRAFHSLARNSVASRGLDPDLIPSLSTVPKPEPKDLEGTEVDMEMVGKALAEARTRQTRVSRTQVGAPPPLPAPDGGAEYQKALETWKQTGEWTKEMPVRETEEQMGERVYLELYSKLSREPTEDEMNDAFMAAGPSTSWWDRIKAAPGKVSERTGFTRFSERFMDPVAATGLQVLQSPLGQGLPGGAELRGIQEAAEDIGAEEYVPGVEAKSFEELRREGVVNPLAAALGSEEEQERAQQVLSGAGFVTGTAARLVFDPLNLIPGIGFTKARHFYRLAKIPLRSGAPAANALINRSPKLRHLLERIGKIDMVEFEPVLGFAEDPERVRVALTEPAAYTTKGAEVVGRRGSIPTAHIPEFDPVMGTLDEPLEWLSRRAEAVEEGFQPPKSPPPPNPNVAGLIEDAEPWDLGLWRRHENGLFLGDRANDLLRKTAEVVADIPIVRNILRSTMGPAALARIDATVRAGVVYRRLQGIQNAELSIRVAQLEVGYKGLFQETRAGMIRLADGSEVAFGDYATDVLAGGKNYGFSKVQQEWIHSAKGLIDDEARLYKHATGESLAGLGADYWPRFALNEQGKVIIKSRIGAKQSPVMKRVFEEQQQAIARGTQYAGPLDAVRLYGASVQKMVRDELLLKVVKEDKLARTVRPGLSHAITNLSSRVKRWRKTKPEEIGEISKMERRLAKLVETREKVGHAKLGEVSWQSIGPAFSRAYSSPQTKEMLESIIGPGLTGKPGKALRGTAIAASIPRFLVTGALDVGHFFLQGLTLLATDPAAWSKAVGKSLQSWAMPQSYNRWLATSPVARKAARYGVDLAGTEWTEITRNMGFLGGIAQKTPGGRTLSDIGGAFPRSFETFIATSKAFNFDNLADLALKGGDSPDELFRVAGYVNTKLGTPNMLGLGLSTTQRQVESAFLLYSPRYTRSIPGMLGWAMGKGVPASDARKALAGMLFAGSSSFYGFARALGLSHEEATERLNPASGSKFLSLPFGQNEFGMGSGYRAALGFLGSLAREDSWDFDSWDQVAFDNPLARYLRARTSPVTGTLIDFIEGEDFLGKEVSFESFVDDPARLLDYSERKFLPLNVEAMLEVRGPLYQHIAAGLVETIGGRAFPRSAYNLYREAQEGTFSERSSAGEQPYTKYTSYEELREHDAPAAESIDNSSEVLEAVERMERERRWKQETQESLGFRNLDETREAQETEQLEDDRRLSSGTVSMPTWKEGLRTREHAYFVRREQILADFGLQFKDKEAPSGSVNAALEAYFEVDAEKYVNPYTGGVNWSEFFDEREEALDRLTSTERKSVMEYIRRYQTPTVRSFRDAQDELRPFWGVGEDVWGGIRSSNPEVFGNFPTLDSYKAGKYTALVAMGISPEEAFYQVDRLPEVKSVKSMVDEARFQYRLENPDTDALLIKWGYASRPAREQVSYGGRRRGGVPSRRKPPGIPSRGR